MLSSQLPSAWQQGKDVWARSPQGSRERVIPLLQVMKPQRKGWEWAWQACEIFPWRAMGGLRGGCLLWCQSDVVATG